MSFDDYKRRVIVVKPWVEVAAGSEWGEWFYALWTLCMDSNATDCASPEFKEAMLLELETGVELTIENIKSGHPAYDGLLIEDVKAEVARLGAMDLDAAWRAVED